MEYMETVFDLGARDEEDAAFEELDKKLKRERKLLQLKQEKEAAAELEALKKEVEEELKETAMEERSQFRWNQDRKVQIKTLIKTPLCGWLTPWVVLEDRQTYKDFYRGSPG